MTNGFNILVLVMLFLILGCVLLTERTVGKRESALQSRCEELEQANQTLADLYVACQSEIDRKERVNMKQVKR